MAALGVVFKICEQIWTFTPLFCLGRNKETLKREKITEFCNILKIVYYILDGYNLY